MIQKYSFIVTLMMLFGNTFAIADNSVEQIRVAKCEIKGTKPIRGSERCLFYPEYVVVNSCKGPPCKSKRDGVSENPYFKCPKVESPTPPWVSRSSADRMLIAQMKRSPDFAEFNASNVNAAFSTGELRHRTYYYASDEAQAAEARSLVSNLQKREALALAGVEQPQPLIGIIVEGSGKKSPYLLNINSDNKVQNAPILEAVELCQAKSSEEKPSSSSIK